MVATARVAAAAQIIPSYSPVDANVQSHLIQWFIGPTRVCPPNNISIGSAVFS